MFKIESSVFDNVKVTAKHTNIEIVPILGAGRCHQEINKCVHALTT